MALAPNCERIVAALAAEYPQEFADCHRPELGARAWAFIRRVAWVLHSTVDIRFGLNGKRGNVDDPSMDAVSFRNPASAAGGVEIIDVVAGAGAPGARAGWMDVTQATIDAGTTGAYIAPEPVTPITPPVVTPPPGGGTAPGVCRFTACTCSEDIAGLYESVGNLIVAQEATSARLEDVYRALVVHLEDVKARVERVSQELANKPVTRCKVPW